ncbi:MAG: hypothetical protein IIA17_00695 [candidate division Zixibacteria bacterium]|nr:hypothetical protein [candidate division Zixibacteria bacterium]
MRFLSNLVITTAFTFVLVACSSDKNDSSKKDSGANQTQQTAKSDPYNSQQKSSGSTEITITDYQMSGIEFTLDGKPMSIAGITFTPASQWQDFGPSGMRAASYAYGPLEPDTNASTLAVFHFGKGQGGTIEANMDRWIKQFSLPDGRDPATATITYERTVAGYPAHVMTLFGIYNESVRPMSQEKIAREEYRLVAIIVEAPGGNVFFKLTGPD